MLKKFLHKQSYLERQGLKLANTLKKSIGEQFDDARASTKLSGGAEPSLPRRLFNDPKNLALAL